MDAVRLGFFKLNVPDLAVATEFWRNAFGFAVTGRVDEPAFLEHIMALPGQQQGPNLMLVQYKDKRDVTVGPGHGAVGFVCVNIRSSHDHALRSGAIQVNDVFEAGGTKISVLRSPQGHEIELIQLPG